MTKHCRARAPSEIRRAPRYDRLLALRDGGVSPLSRARSGNRSKVLVYGVLYRALCIADPFLNLTLRVLRGALGLEFGVACRFSNAFFDLPGRLVCKAGNFIAGATHMIYLETSGPSRYRSLNLRKCETFLTPPETPRASPEQRVGRYSGVGNRALRTFAPYLAAIRKLLPPPPPGAPGPFALSAPGLGPARVGAHSISRRSSAQETERSIRP